MYGKLFVSMYDGTLAANWTALVTFQQMVILCGPDGVIDMTPESLSRRTGIPLDILKEGIAILEAPDPGSRTPDEEGRRILRLSDHREWGWQLVNHKHYRDLVDEEQRRDQIKMATRRWREKKHSPESVITNDHPCSPVIKGEQSDPIQKQKQKHLKDSPDSAFERVWANRWRKANDSKQDAEKAWNARIAEGCDPVAMEAGHTACRAMYERDATEPKFTKSHARFFGPGRHWENEYGEPTPGMIKTVDEHGIPLASFLKIVNYRVAA